MMSTNTDHFTPLARQYASFRPSYPEELFDWLASIAPLRQMAWDCGAGNGQATVELAARFEQVLATDISAAQLAAAPPRANVEYRAAPAEASGLPAQSADLVTIAQALHWFDLPKFYAEVHRVLKPHGVIAAWGYNRLRIDHAGLQQVLDRFYDETIGAYWPPERLHVENGYRDLAFPFARIASPEFALHKEWQREHLLGYLRSWSAVGRFQAALGFDPVDELAEEIGAYWREGVVYRIEWPLFMHVGRVDQGTPELLHSWIA
ncbi:class I SAM-dependent methyltransferase [Sideroxydans lithotrophicus]|uniref:Methyltransferase type 11 n=1 Tax=Sideroxydans lithotrophicus (strain ES-1) TaxID=580332 RepID=D5CUP8_SIDLE|nr:class I SAM-dependent methyltransferase [Sideroxydans lithotrophicus]ADE12435.1 Methyltransferase type 11 [Sideroxydans lithotrophicus ES-1]